jgi:peptidoglycan/LPS O-acetylase OafA/YrhL
MTEGKAERLYYPALDTLRGVFSIVVMLFHIVCMAINKVDPPSYAVAMRGPLGAGAFGVPFFFVLSSFLITNLLLQEREKTGRVDVPRFYARRILRVWPVYFAVLLGAFFVVEQILGLHPHQEQWIVPMTFFFANNLMPGQFGPSMSFAPLWSVSIEEQFYLVWPWLARWSPPRVIAILGCLLVLAAMVYRWYRFEPGITSHIHLWYSTLTHLDSIGVGVLASLANRYLDTSWIRRNFNWVAIACLAVVVGIQSSTATLIDIQNLRPAGIWTYTLVPVCGGLVVLAGAQQAEGVSKFWNNPVGLWFGRVSYSLYAFHGYAVVLICERIRPDLGDAIGKSVLAALASVALAAVGDYVIERPALNWKSTLQIVKSGTA